MIVSLADLQGVYFRQAMLWKRVLMHDVWFYSTYLSAWYAI